MHQVTDKYTLRKPEIGDAGALQAQKNDPEVALAALCVKCGAALHACAQCRHFDGGAPFQCRQPVPAPIAAKSRANECTFYEPAVTLDLTGRKATDTPDQARSAFDALFGKKK